MEQCRALKSDPSVTIARVGKSSLCVASLCAFAIHFADAAAIESADTSALKKLSVEELMNLEVTSVSKTEERLGGAAAAIAVVTGEDIRRSGATTIPDSLRFVPGLHVASQTASAWAVSSRGFSSTNSEKLLVLTDTRSVYTPLFSGVFWDVQDYVMEDIDRIEVIRGPGAALWGSNAVNGVINITTKNARDTQGFYGDAGVGTEERAFVTARYGGASGDAFHYRVFAKYFDRDGSFEQNPATSDDWRLAHIGFRTDASLSETDGLTVQGDAYRGNIGGLTPSVTIIGRPGPSGDLETHVSGGNVLGRWRHTLSQDSDLQLRAYYDRTRRDDPSFLDTLDTLDFDFQHKFGVLSQTHQILWGLNYRYTSNRNQGKGIFAVDPPTSRDTVESGFIQDQIAIGKTLHVTIGTKLEHNDFSGFEWQPSVSAAWDLSANRTLWAAISRAVRVPTRLERDISIDVTDPSANPLVRLQGNRDFESEKLIAYELGYRQQVNDRLFLDIAAFHNRYEGLASLELGTPFVEAGSGRTIVPIVNENLTDGTADGFGALVTYAATPHWKVAANYSYTNLQLDPRGLDLNRGRFLEGATPRHQLGLRSYLDLPGDIELDVHFRYLSDIESLPPIVNGTGVPGYSELDVRIAWQPTPRTELALVGRNLLHDHHVEFGEPAARGEIERSVYGRFTWRN